MWTTPIGFPLHYSGIALVSLLSSRVTPVLSLCRSQTRTLGTTPRAHCRCVSHLSKLQCLPSLPEKVHARSLAWYLRSPWCGLTPLHHAHSLPVQSMFQALSTVSPAWSSPKFPNPCHHSSFRSFSSSPSCTFCVMFKSLSSRVRGTWIPCSQFCTQQFGVIFMAHLSCSRQHCKKTKNKKNF